jgi:SAM-dependent methyltransferase
MVELTTGQVSTSAARIYEELYVPALFSQWAPQLLDRAGLRPGARVLDVACGTGVVAREAARRAGAEHVTGLDINDEMLGVAREKGPAISWRNGSAEDLPFSDASFEAVVCQFALMFFEDRQRALREMWRVLVPGGRLVVAVWDGLESSPGYSAWIALIEEELGPDAAAGLRSPFVLGDTGELRRIFAAAGINEPGIETVDGWGTFDSVEAWVEIDVRGWVLSDQVDEAVLARLQSLAKDRLGGFVDERGRTAFGAPAHIVTATK